MSRMPNFYQPGGGPLRWQDDATGVLPIAVKAFLNSRLYRGKLAAEQLELVRDYCEYYIGAPCWDVGEGDFSATFAALRQRIKTIKTSDDLEQWMIDALSVGIDPL